jgi:flagellar motor switch protein FliG
MAKKTLSGEEKAAILLQALGEDVASEVMRFLDPRDIRKIGVHMTALSGIAADVRTDVMKEFQSSRDSGDIGFEGKEYIKNLLTKALGKDKAGQILDTMTSVNYPGLESLKWLEPKAVAEMIKTEHPQTIAVILAHMDADQAGQVMTLLPDFLRADVTLRFATIDGVQPEVLQTLSDVLQELFKSNTAGAAKAIGGVKAVAEMMTRLDKTTETSLMGKLASKDPTLAESIRSLMFVFDDLVKIDSRGIQEMMKEVSKEDLPVALKGAAPEVRDLFLRNMSTRAAQTFNEDMEARGPVKLKDVEKAQQNILKLVRKLEEEGKIVIGGGGGEETV